MDTETARPSGLGSRDLITIGIFNAMILVLYVVLQAIMQPIPGMGLVNGGVTAMVMAPLYLLLLVKVRKPGVLTITSILYALLVAAVGMYSAIPFVLVGGVVGDIIGSTGKFASVKTLIAAYVSYKTLEMVGNYSIIVINPQRYAANLEPAVREQFMKGVALFTPVVGVLCFILTVAGGLVGGAVAAKLLRKHFQRAGLVTL